MDLETLMEINPLGRETVFTSVWERLDPDCRSSFGEEFKAWQKWRVDWKSKE